MEFLIATFQQLTDFFLRLAGDSAALIYLLIFVTVIVIVVAVFSVFGSKDQVQRRLSEGSQVITEDDIVQGLRREGTEKPWTKLLDSLEEKFAGEDEKKKSTQRQKMIHAGYFGPNSVRNYYIARVISAVGFPAVLFLGLAVTPNEASINVIIFLSVMLTFVGLILPTAWVNRKISLRQLAVQESFPDALDMMVVCVEAGLGLDGAMNRVGQQIAPAHPILAQHFGLAALELRAGKSRAEALRAFSNRIGLTEINSFVTLLIQSDSLGTSIGQTLRVYSEEMRTNRMLRAEEKAQRLPVLLSIPLVVGILPSMLTVALLPAIIRVIRVLFPALGGDLR